MKGQKMPEAKNPQDLYGQPDMTEEVQMQKKHLLPEESYEELFSNTIFCRYEFICY